MTDAHLRLEFLGTFRVTLQGQSNVRFESSKAKALLVYLALESDQEHSREKLASLLWPEGSKSRVLHNLREALRTLRKALGGKDVADRFIHVTRKSVQFRKDAPYWLDVEAFLSYLSPSLSLVGDNVQALEKAVSLYKGDLLEGIILADTPQWNEWLTAQREHLHRLMTRTLLKLADYYEASPNLEKAEQYLRQLIHLEPWDEEAHRRLMYVLARAGRRQDALAQYETCKRLLKEGLAADPSEETQRLYEDIRSGRISPHSPNGYMRSPHKSGGVSTFFIGREDELKHIAAYLENPECRLVTITGLGGIGKSTLAREVARLYGATFRDHVTFVPLQSVESPALVPQAVAQALGILWGEVPDVRSRVLQYLEGKEMLLILDNFEHVLEAQDFVLEIIQRAPRVKILITSLEPLGLYHEWLFHLKGLPYPTESHVSQPMKYDAIRWFVQAARRVNPQFTLTDEDVPWVIRICQFVQGSPLGILLATTWLTSTTIEDVACSIEQDPDLLQAKLPDLPRRHQSMRAVFEYTWQWLSPQEQSVFRRLGVFQGPFTRRFAEDIADADLSTLARLVTRSLVMIDQPGRYTLHPLLRRYARSKLALAPEEEHATYTRYAQYILGTLASQEEALQRKTMREAMDEILSYLPEIRAAWRWTAEQGPVAWLHQALNALYLFYDMHGAWEAAETLLAQTLDALATRGDKDSRSVRRLYGRVYTVRAWFLHRLSRLSDALTLLREARPLLRTYGTPEDIAFYYFVLGVTYTAHGDYDQGYEYLKEAQKFYQKYYRPFELALTHIHLAHALDTMGGDTHTALTLYEEALYIFRELEHPLGIAFALNSIGTCEYNLGHYEAARQAYEESLKLKEEIGDRLGLAMTLNNLGSIAAILHQPTLAKNLFQRSMELYDKAGNRWGVGYVSMNLGNLALSRGQAGMALQYFMRALHIYRKLGHRWGTAMALRYLAKLYTVQGRWERAREALLEAIDLASRLGADPLSLYVFAGAGMFLLYRGKVEEGMVLLQFAFEHKAGPHELRAEIEELIASAPVPIPSDIKYRAWRKAHNLSIEELHQQAYTWILTENPR